VTPGSIDGLRALLFPFATSPRDVTTRTTNLGSRSRNRRAVTLADVVLVVAIIAVLGAIAVPRYSLALARYRVAAAGQRIAADILLAQTVGRTSSAGQAVSFSVSSNNYQLPGYSSFLGGGTQASYTVSLAADPYQATLVSASFNGNSQITFDRFGQPDNAGTVVVQVGSQQKTITVDTTGKVTVQ
jgi:Tfp pilus assembly protein FimT